MPIIWNGITLFHYVSAHTHTFCKEDITHTHTDTGDCLSIFQLAENHNQNQLPVPNKREFKEIKQYLSPIIHLTSKTTFAFQQINFVDSSLPDFLFSEDVFHPPIPV